MKKLYTFLVVVLTTLSSTAQIVNIPDANFKAKLLSANISNTVASSVTPTYGINSNMTVSSYNKIDTNNDGEIQVSEAQNIKWLNIIGSNIASLTGIEAFSNLQYLHCPANQIATINLSQNTNLVYLNCNQNQLTELNVSQNIGLTILFCFYNQLTGLDVSQNTSLKELYCYENAISTLNVTQNPNLIKLYCYSNLLNTLNISENTDLIHLLCYDNLLSNLNVTLNTSLQHLVCNTNQLTSLDVTQNPSLTYLNCGQNLITTLDVTQNTNLTQIICKENQLANLNVSQNTHLNWLDCKQNQLTTLDVTQFPNLLQLLCNDNQLATIDLSQNLYLTELNCKNNLLTTLFLKNNNDCWCLFSDEENGSRLIFTNNPSISYICADEEDIVMLQQKLINYGYANSCQVNSYCSFVPGGTFYTLQGNTRFDTTNNGCDVTDLNIPNQRLTFTSGSLSGSLIASNTGAYFYPVQEGTHTITPNFENPGYFTASPTTATVTFPATASPFTQDFCVTANGVHNDVELTVLPIFVARPGFDATYKIIYKNKGNQVSNGSLSFSFNDAVMDLVSALPVNTSSATNSLIWAYSNLNPFETREINLTFNINSPMETPAVNAGTILNYTATIVGATDEMPNDNTFTLNQTVVNSYDPNDKTCLEGSTITPSMVGQYVHYVIRFENTGTFPAQNVVVTDVIDTTKFDLSSLVPQSSSHSYVTRINNTTGKVEFIFENINLPFDDATNDGYVAFKIKTKSTLVLGNTFSNTANIYFDYNFPIVTNTATTTIATLANQDFNFGSYFTVYPVPAKDVLHLNTKKEIGLKSLSIYNTLGQMVLAVTNPDNNTTIDIANLKTGTYFIKVMTDKGTANTKFIKE